jgi:4,5-DOPA dioxygenase extradiol
MVKIPTNSLKYSSKMPALFLGHGSPMNAIEENEFVSGFRQVSAEFESPQAILCISAHWETRGTRVTAMDKPRTIHDFGGFPQALFDVQYPAPGSPELAESTQQTIQSTEIELDHSWGLDHGAWSVIKHMYPHANVPVIQMSLDRTKPMKYHYELAKELSSLREKGVLIIGSGNIIHNLRAIHWQKMNEHFAYDWAEETSQQIKKFIKQRDHSSLINIDKLGTSAQLSIPTPEHYLPLLYILALQGADEDHMLFNDQPLGGSISMTSVKIG